MLWTIFLVGMLGTFGLNFPIVLTAMAKSAFGGNASTYGLFNIVLGLGSAARRGARRGRAPAADAGRSWPRRPCSASSQAAAALAPDLAVFLVLLAAMGFVNLVCQAMANASVQLAVDPELRGRVMGLYMLVFIGGTPIGAPIIGAITSHYGARAGMLAVRPGAGPGRGRGGAGRAGTEIAAARIRAARRRGQLRLGLTTGTVLRMLNGTTFRLFATEGAPAHDADDHGELRDRDRAAAGHL